MITLTSFEGEIFILGGNWNRIRNLKDRLKPVPIKTLFQYPVKFSQLESTRPRIFFLNSAHFVLFFFSPGTSFHPDIPIRMVQKIVNSKTLWEGR